MFECVPSQKGFVVEPPAAAEGDHLFVGRAEHVAVAVVQCDRAAYKIRAARADLDVDRITHARDFTSRASLSPSSVQPTIRPCERTAAAAAKCGIPWVPFD